MAAVRQFSVTVRNAMLDAKETAIGTSPTAFSAAMTGTGSGGVRVMVGVSLAVGVLAMVTGLPTMVPPPRWGQIGGRQAVLSG